MILVLFVVYPLRLHPFHVHRKNCRLTPGLLPVCNLDVAFGGIPLACLEKTLILLLTSMSWYGKS